MGASMWAQLKMYCLPFYLLVGFVFITSGLIVCFLMLLTYIFVWPFDKALYRKMVINLAYTHWSQLTFLAQWWAGSECVLHFENPADFEKMGKEHVIVLMNHKYEIDWLMAWILAERLQMLGGSKIYGKSSLRFVPLIGWMWTFTESIFLKREWDKDKEIISRDLRYITSYPDGYWVTLLLFCEGTRFTEAKHVASMKVAREKGRPELKHHLLPRTKGFVHSMHGLKGKIPAILDLTIGFRSDGAKPSLMSIVTGQACQAEMYVRRIPLEDVPTDTDEACSEWLHKFFQEKDKIYDHFVQNGCYRMGKRCMVPWRVNDLVTWLIWVLLLGVPTIYYLAHIFMSGSLTLQLVIIAVVVTVSIAVRKVIAVTEIEKASEYGETHAYNNGIKKEQ